MKPTLSLSALNFRSFNIHILGLALTMITACSLFKEKTFFRADSLHRRTTHKESNQQYAGKAESLNFYSINDSADRQTVAVIFPKGPFNYSLTSGFSGEAERVLINERAKESRQLQASQRSNEASQLNLSEKASDRVITQTRMKDKKVETRNFNLWIGLSCAFIVFLIYLFKRS